MLPLIVVALGFALAAPTVSTAAQSDFSHGSLDAVAFADQVAERAKGYGSPLRLKVARCDSRGCEFEGPDQLVLSVRTNRMLKLQWRTGPKSPGPIALVAAVETLLQDKQAALRLLGWVRDALVANPMFNSFEIEGYTVATGLLGDEVSVTVDPARPPRDDTPRR